MPTNADHCVSLVRQTDHERYLATLFAPSEHRDALFALYAFNVEILRVRDMARQPLPGEIRLQWWREALTGMRTGEAAANPVAAALLKALARYGLPGERLLPLIDAHTFDLYDEPMAMLDDLDAYARNTQGTLLQTAAAMLGGAGPAAGALIEQAAIAYAVTDALSLLGRHAARRQLFLPLEVLERHQVKPVEVLAMQSGAPLKAALAELRRHARRQLTGAGAQLAAAQQVLPALLPLAIVGPTLQRMERADYAPFQFLSPSRLSRQWWLWRAARKPSRIFAA